MVSLKMVWGPDWGRVVGGAPEGAEAIVAYETEQEAAWVGLTWHVTLAVSILREESGQRARRLPYFPEPNRLLHGKGMK